MPGATLFVAGHHLAMVAAPCTSVHCSQLPENCRSPLTGHRASRAPASVGELVAAVVARRTDGCSRRRRSSWLAGRSTSLVTNISFSPDVTSQFAGCSKIAHRFQQTCSLLPAKEIIVVAPHVSGSSKIACWFQHVVAVDAKSSRRSRGSILNWPW